MENCLAFVSSSSDRLGSEGGPSIVPRVQDFCVQFAETLTRVMSRNAPVEGHFLPVCHFSDYVTFHRKMDFWPLRSVKYPTVRRVVSISDLMSVIRHKSNYDRRTARRSTKVSGDPQGHVATPFPNRFRFFPRPLS